MPNQAEIERLVRMAMQEEFLHGDKWPTRVVSRSCVAAVTAERILAALTSTSKGLSTGGEEE